MIHSLEIDLKMENLEQERKTAIKEIGASRRMREKVRTKVMRPLIDNVVWNLEHFVKQIAEGAAVENIDIDNARGIGENENNSIDVVMEDQEIVDTIQQHGASSMSVELIDLSSDDEDMERHGALARADVEGIRINHWMWGKSINAVA